MRGREEISPMIILRRRDLLDEIETWEFSIMTTIQATPVEHGTSIAINSSIREIKLTRLNGYCKKFGRRQLEVRIWSR